MRTLLCAVVLSLLADNALAGSHRIPWAEHQARSYLADCPADPAAQPACVADQERFVQTYQDAESGSAKAQNEIAAVLMAGSAAVRQTPVQGCAWRIVAANADLAHVVPAEVEAASRFCAPAGATALKLAKARARQIMTRMAKGGILERSGTDHSDPEDD
jgi:hypothetical protein